MKAVSLGRRRPLRWVFVFLCIGGGVFAAENNWFTSFRVGHSLTNWLARLVEDKPAPQLVLTDTTKTPDTNYEVNSWLNTALFSPPSTGWTLSARPSGGSISQAEQSGPAAFYSANLPTASFSSGFISYNPGIYFGPMPTAPNVSGTWSATTSGNWSNAANWSAGQIADGAGNNANFNAANLTSDITVTLDSSRTIGNLFVGDTDNTHSYTIAASGGSTLTFDINVAFGIGVLQQTATSHGDTVSVPILLMSDLAINNLSTSRDFTVTGNIAGASGPSTGRTLWFNLDPGSFGSYPGTVRVSGNISNGSTGAVLSVSVAGGTVFFTGTNSYTGSTSVNDGTLLVNGNNGAATGTVFVGSGGTLGGTGTVGGTIQTFDGTITGATAGTVGTLTLLSNVDLSTHEGTGTYWADLSGSLSDLLKITGSLSLGQGSILDIHGVGDGVTTYTLATFASRDDVFGSVSGIPSGYSLVYHDMDIQLVPIPEPATWIGGTLALGVIAAAARRRRMRNADCGGRNRTEIRNAEFGSRN